MSNSLSDLEKNKDDKEPALRVGTVGSSVAGVLALVMYLFPDIPEDQLRIIFVVTAFVLPIATAVFTRGRVWSPNSVDDLVTRAVDDAVTVTKIFHGRNSKSRLDDGVVEVID